MERWQLDWRFGSASVLASAAMLWECEFKLPSGRRFKPFARAPWAGSPALDPGLPAHLRQLGGEFVCVPFGIGGQPEQLAAEWRSASWSQINPKPHGYSADATWTCQSMDSHHLLLHLAYPEGDDVDYLTRRMQIDPEHAAIDLELRVHVRRPTWLPIGLHPILRLPSWPEQLMLDARYAFGMTYPASLPPGISRVSRGRQFEALNAVPTPDGVIDYSTLPKQEPTEELMMLCQVRGPVTARYLHERCFFRLTWDTDVLPSCLLWPSDRSLTDPPWERRFRGVGIEPIAAAFDASCEVSIEDNPLNRAGVSTAVSITPDRPLSIRYRMEAGEW